MLSHLQLREIFHFCFLEQLLRIADSKIFVLKGGVNLRFFFRSPRYSEDMDIDVLAGSITTLKKNGYKILSDLAFRRRLQSYGIQDLIVGDQDKAKHTETTQRFKLRIVTESGEALATKIEFSRRKNTDTYTTELSRIDTEISSQYKRLPYLALHYTGESALIQKIEALAGRTQVQVRDVFDINILDLGSYGFNREKVSPELLSKASEALLSLSYDDFRGHVLEFLNEDYRLEYSSKLAWNELQHRVLRIINPCT